MRNFILFLVVLLALCSPLTPLHADGTVTVNNGSETHGYIPFNGYNFDAAYMHSQFLFPSSLLTALNGKSLSSMQFYMTVPAGYPHNQHNWTITLMEVTDASLTTSYKSVSSGTVVYTGSIDLETTTPTITFSTPFVYTGGNLLVDMRYSNNPGDFENLNFYGVSSSGMSIEAHGSSDPTSGYAQNFSPKTTFSYTNTSSCNDPRNLTVTSISDSSAAVSWSASGLGESLYQYVAVTSGTTPDWANATLVSTTSCTVTGLNANTVYDLYLRSYCSATEQSDGITTTFRSACVAVTPESLGTIGFESSEGFSTGVGSLVGPNCWMAGNAQSASSDYIPNVYDFASYQGSNCLQLYAYQYPGLSIYASGAYAVLPRLDFSATPINRYEISFYARRPGSNSSYNDTVWVGVMTNPSDISTFTYVGYALVNTTTFTQYTVSLAPYTGNAPYIALRANVNPNSSATKKYGAFYIDNISFSQTVSCLPLDSVSVSEITHSSLRVSWTDDATATNRQGYQVVCSTTDDPLSATPAAVASSAHYIDITGLAPESHYYIYVRADCGSSDGQSAWIRDTATTLVAPTACPALKSAPAASSVTSNSAVLTWNTGQGEHASSYDLVYATEEITDFTTLPASAVTISSIPDTTDTLTALSPNTYYYSYIRVNCVNESHDDGSSAWSAACLFATLDTSTQITSFTITNAEVIGSEIIDTEYNYITAMVRKGTDLSNIGFNIGTAHSAITLTVGGQPFTSPWDFSSFVTVRVAAEDTNIVDEWYIELFEEDCATPYGVHVTDIDRRSALLNWSIGDSATTSFDFIISDSAVADYGAWTPLPITATNVDGSCSYPLSGLLLDHSYYVYIRTNCGTSTGQWRGDYFSTLSLLTCTDTALTAYNVTTAINVPIYGYGTDATQQTQSIYPAADLTNLVGKSIYDIHYFVTSGDNTGYWDDITYTVKMGTTTQATFSDGFITTGLTQVYSGTISANTNDGLHIHFDQPFLYSGGNLVIEFQTLEAGDYQSLTYRVNTATNASRYQYGGNAAYNTDYLPYIQFTTCVRDLACPEVTDITVDNIQPSAARAGWVPGGEESSWEYHLATRQMTEDELNALANQYRTDADTTSITLGNLSADSDYYLYVRGICGLSEGDTSVWTGVSFHTLPGCGIVAVDGTHPFVHGFDSTPFISHCWVNGHVAGSATDVWSADGSVRHGVSGQSAILPLMPAGNITNLVLPHLHIPAANEYEFSFWIYRSSGSMADEGVKVWLNTTPDTVGGTSLMHIRTAYGQGEVTESEEGWYRYSAAIPDSGNVYLMLEGISEAGNNTYIDDISVSVRPAYSVTVSAVSSLGTTSMVCNPLDTTSTGLFYLGSTPLLTALPDTGMTFTCWTNNSDTLSTDNPWSLSVSADTAIVANFDTASYNLHVTILPGSEAFGSVEGSGSFRYMRNQSFSALPAAHYHAIWSDSVTDLQRSVIMPAHDTTFTVNFVIDQHTVSASVNRPDWGTVSGGGVYDYNASVTLTATPADPHYHFAGWSDGNADNPYTLTLTQDTALTASFTADQYEVSTAVDVPERGTTSGDSIFNYGDTATLVATAIYPYYFTFWSNGNDTLTTDTIHVPVLGDTTYTAHFISNLFTVSVLSADSAKGTVSGSGLFYYSDVDTIAASPALNHHFTGWSNGSTDNPLYLTVTSDSTVTAHFAIDSFSVSANAATGGTVSGGGVYPYGSSVTLTAIPDAHHHFTNWSNGDSSSVITFIVESDTSLTAHFAVDQHIVAVSVSDTAAGSVSPDTAVYNYGDTVTITATPNGNYHFVNWSNGDTATVITFIVESDTALTANFAINQHTVAAQVNDNTLGYVLGTGSYNHGATASLMAINSAHCHFSHWSNGDTASVISFTVVSDTTLTAYFAVDSFTVTGDVSGVGSIEGPGRYAYGSSVTLTATPADGCQFAYWTYTDADTTFLDYNAALTFTITQDVTVTATFTGTPTAVDPAGEGSFVAYSEYRDIIVLGAADRTVSVYGMNGRLIGSVSHASDIERFSVNAAGVYMIRIGNRAISLILVK